MSYDIEIGSLIEEINKLKSDKGYLFAGSPKFLGIFGRDTLISSWELLEYDPSIAKNTLMALATLQGKAVNNDTQEEPGKIPHEYYPENTSKEWFKQYKGEGTWPKIGVAEYLSVDSTPLFVMVLTRYYEKTKDKDTLERLWPNAINALDWIINYATYKGLVRYVPKENKLLSQSWKDGIGKLLDSAVSPVAVVEVQGYAYKAIRDAVYLMNVLDDNIHLDRFEIASQNLKKNFESSFWMKDEDYYAIAIDGNNKQINSVASNPGQLLFTDILGMDKADAIVKRLFMDDMFTQYGIRTHSSKDRFFDPLAYQLGAVWPHDNWIIAQGLKHLGYEKEYDMVKTALINAAMELKSIPEYYGVSKEGKLIPLKDLRTEPCDPQAWSLGALVSMLYKP